MKPLLAVVLILLGFLVLSAGVLDLVRAVIAQGPGRWDGIKRGLAAAAGAILLLAVGGHLLETSSGASAFVLLVVSFLAMAAVLVALAVWNTSWAPFSAGARSASSALWAGAVTVLVIVFGVLFLRDRPLPSMGAPTSRNHPSGGGVLFPDIRLDRLWPTGTFAGLEPGELWLWLMLTGLVVFGLNRAPWRKVFWIPLLATLTTVVLCR